MSREKTIICLCPYCNEPFDLKMKEKFDLSTSEGDSCGVYEQDLNWELSIHCSKCKRLVYKKEGKRDLL